MKIPFEMILSFTLGLALISILGYVLLVPRKFLWRIAAGAVLGAVFLLILNAFSNITGFSININPFTALSVGILGLPGALMIILLSQYLF